MPDLEEEFHQKYADQGLVVVGVDPDRADGNDPERVGAWTDALGATFPVVLETSDTYDLFAALYEGASPYPIDVVVDRRGYVRYVAREYDPGTLDEIVRELLTD